MREYVELGHMSRINTVDTARVVFDAKKASGLTLNKLLIVGPTIPSAKVSIIDQVINNSSSYIKSLRTLSFIFRVFFHQLINQLFKI